MQTEPVTGCVNHPTRPMRDTLDGDSLCQECCDEWVRNEGHAAWEQERRDAEFDNANFESTGGKSYWRGHRHG